MVQLWLFYDLGPIDGEFLEGNPLPQLSSYRAFRETSFNETSPTNSDNERETIMTKAFETIPFIYGARADSCTDADLIDAIKRVDKEILDLAPMAEQSKFIAKQVIDLNSMKVRIIETLDERMSDK